MIILGGAGPQFDHVALSRVYELMAQGIPVVAMHRNAVWSTREGLRVDTGVYLAGMEQVSGRKAVAVGKPAPAGFQLAAERMGCEPDQVVMVGDDLHVDVLAAQVVGMTGCWCAPANSVRTPWTGGPPISMRCSPPTWSTRSPICRPCCRAYKPESPS